MSTDQSNKELNISPDFMIMDLKEMIDENVIVPLQGKWNAFLFITGGSGILQLDFEEYTAQENRIFFIEKYKIWSWKKINNVSGVLIRFTDTFYNHIYTGNPKIRSDQSLFGEIPPFITVARTELNEWKGISRILLKEYFSPRQNSREIICLFLKILILMYRRNFQRKVRFFESRQRKQMLNDFRKLVNNRFRSLRTSKDYAYELNITPNYLNALCREYFDKTVTEIIQERVILEAKRLLMHSPLSISEIAYNLGFKDNSYFGRFFRKAVRMTPNTFRRQGHIHNNEETFR